MCPGPKAEESHKGRCTYAKALDQPPGYVRKVIGCRKVKTDVILVKKWLCSRKMGAKGKREEK